jgi:hypothetical protein
MPLPMGGSCEGIRDLVVGQPECRPRKSSRGSGLDLRRQDQDRATGHCSLGAASDQAPVLFALSTRRRTVPPRDTVNRSEQASLQDFPSRGH